jgi:hypothetical protein
MWYSDPWDGAESWCLVCTSRNSRHGTVTKIPFSGSQQRQRQHYMLQKKFSLLSLVNMSTVLLFNLRYGYVRVGVGVGKKARGNHEP